MSVWAGIDRDAFEGDLLRLYQQHKLQDCSTLQALHGRSDLSLVLPVHTERELADSFAFLAATTNLPSGVTAAAICQRFEPHSLCLIVAANQGLSPVTSTALEAILVCLRNQASRLTDAPETERSCRRIVVDFHRNRIFGRLGSQKALSQKKNDFDFCARARDLIKMIKPTATGTIARKKLQRVVAAIVLAERCTPQTEAEQSALHEVLQSAFDLMYGERTLFGRLSTFRSRKDFRALRALANYWRTCQFLVKCAGSYKELFLQIDIEVLVPGPTRISNGLQRYVHAEIQIVFHLEKDRDKCSRYIGSSKRPCFLCYCFLRAHGTYGSQTSHGEVYEMWTVPDGALLDSIAQQFLRRALNTTVDDVRRASTRPPRRSRMYSHPIQTVSKILLDRISSGPASTVSPPEQHTLETAIDAMPRLAIDTTTSRTSGTSNFLVEAVTSSQHEHKDMRICSASETYLQAGTLELFLDPWNCKSSSEERTASLRLCDQSEAEHAARLAIRVQTDQVADNELTIVFPDRAAAYLLLEHDNSCWLVRLQW